MGLRELKKQKTRKMISDIATVLFVERGYYEVSIADVAAAAEVSVSTVFNYFESKEALVFDVEAQVEQEIVAAVRNRGKKISVLDALHQYFLASKMLNPPNKKDFAKFSKLVSSTPELSSYLRLTWSRYEKTLSQEIRSTSKASKTEADCLARVVLAEVFASLNSANAKENLTTTFQILKNGWRG